MKYLISILLAFLFVVTSCSKNALSERDARLEQIRQDAELKRRELKKVVGTYRGVMRQETGMEQSVLLKLDIKEVPQSVEGFVDPILVPFLAGYLQMIVGGGPLDYLNYGITDASFDPKTKRLNVKVMSEKYGTVIFELLHQAPKLDGDWTWPEYSSTGSIALEESATPPQISEIQGDYQGIFEWGYSSVFQAASVNLRTTFLPSGGLKIEGTLKMYLGDAQAADYLTYKFDAVEFNPAQSQLIFSSAEADVSVVATVSNGTIEGKWFSKFTPGKEMGTVMLRKQGTVEVPVGKSAYKNIEGEYAGSLVNTQTTISLPSTVSVYLVVSQDLQKTNGVDITGKIRFYTDSSLSEWDERSFTEVNYDFFNRKLVAKASGSEKFTLEASINQALLKGTLAADGYGQVATIEGTQP